ncbi:MULTISPECIES: GNAT family N-acetyltransferase [unclassified Novosphingobium]|uniref:GNAT family N-acetyltransferase n=1 Tax=unclassified Novosphingobium TaxID=2644732 RepID=UPI00197DA07D|nr:MULTISPECIES: GNAT family N-acetyltransferase [unclassified Novosphingobium]
MSGAMVGSESNGVIAMRVDHLDQAQGLSLALKWPYRLEDWQFAFELGRGFAVEAEGKLLGTALWWPYGEDFATIGMIIVSPDAQRQGIGGKLMAALLADAAGRRMTLITTKDGEPLYTKLGFARCGFITQHQAVLDHVPAIDTSVPVRAATPGDRSAIDAVDAAASGMDRRVLLDALLGVADAVVVERDGGISGYGCVRRWGRGVVIGPVVAASAQDAKAIVAVLASAYEGVFVRIDVTETSGLAPWLEEIGLPQVDRAPIMALGAAPVSAPGAMLVALSNQSLG